MVSPKGNEWSTNYWLACCLEGKQTFDVSLMDSEGIDFFIGMMAIKGEYLTLDERTRKKKGSLFEDYRPCHFVCYCTNLIIGPNIQLHTMPRKNSWKVWYFLPYSEHKKLMETISIRSDPDDLLEWYSIELSFYLYLPFTNSIGLTSRPMSPFFSNIVTFSIALSPSIPFPLFSPLLSLSLSPPPLLFHPCLPL